MDTISYTEQFEICHIPAIQSLIFDRTCYLSYTHGGAERGLAFLRDSHTVQKIKKWTHDIMVSAHDRGTLIGFGRAAHDGWITHLYVDWEYQRQGIGSELLLWLESMLCKEGLEHLFVASDPKKSHFYKGHGYIPATEKPYEQNGRLFIQMEKTIR